MTIQIVKWGLYILLGVIVIVTMIAIYNPTKHRYQSLVKLYKQNLKQEIPLITEEDLSKLPDPVQHYLAYCGVGAGSPQVLRYDITFTGQMKLDESKAFSDINSAQTSFQSNPVRLFYMTMNYQHLPIAGLHHFAQGSAAMNIRLLNVLPIVNASGGVLDQAEMVTILNDMAVFAPATLIDERIQWETIDSTHVNALFTLNDNSVSATLVFNEEHQLINFYSDDRYFAKEDNTYERVTWSTPITEYQDINGRHVPKQGSAVWHFPDREFEYIRLTIESIEYNKEM